MSSRRTAVVPIYCVLLLVGGQWPMTSPAYAAAFTVNNISDTHDAKPGDGICAIPNSKNVNSVGQSLYGLGTSCALRAKYWRSDRHDRGQSKD
jgi:hypothetical protein